MNEIELLVTKMKVDYDVEKGHGKYPEVSFVGYTIPFENINDTVKKIIDLIDKQKNMKFTISWEVSGS